MADENPEEPTLRTRSMADVLAEQGDIVGALEIYQELEAAAPTPEEARELHDSVAALVSRMAGNSTEPGEQTEIRRTFVWRRGRAESVDVPSGVVSGSPRSTGARIARPFTLESCVSLQSSFITTALIGSLVFIGGCSTFDSTWKSTKAFYGEYMQSPRPD